MKTLMLLIAMVIVLSSNAESNLENLMLTNNYEEAIKYIDSCYPVSKRDINVWKKHGIAFEALGQNSKAISSYVTVITKNPRDEDVLRSLLKLYSDEHSFYNAYSTVQRLLELKSYDTKLLLQAAKICIKLKRLQEAESYLLTIHAFNSEAKKLLGDIYYNDGQIEQAISFYKAYFDKEKDIDVAKILVKYCKTNVSEIIEQLQFIVDNDKNDTLAKKFLEDYWKKLLDRIEITENNMSEIKFDSYVTLGDKNMNKKNYIEAINNYKEAIKINPKSLNAFIKLANCQILSNDIDKAILSYERIISEWSPQAISYKILGDLYKSKGKIHEAVVNYKIFLKTDEDNRLSTYVAMYENIKGDYETALKYFNRITNFTSEVLYAKGNTFFCLQQYERAIEVFKYYLKTYSSSTKEYYFVNKVIGMSYDITKRNSSAIPYFLVYLEKFNDSNIAYRVGELLETTDLKAALEIYKKNSEKYPDDYRNFAKMGVLIRG